jgi:hypothetical protein
VHLFIAKGIDVKAIGDEANASIKTDVSGNIQYSDSVIGMEMEGFSVQEF